MDDSMDIRERLSLSECKDYFFGGADLDSRTVIFSEGGGLIFKTNAERILVSAQLKYSIKGNFQTTGITTLRGLCMSISKDDGKTWENVRIVSSDTTYKKRFPFYRYAGDRPYMICIWFPLAATVTKMSLTFFSSKNISIEKVPFRGSCMFVGGPYTYGIGSTTTSNIIPNIVLRKTMLQTYNMGKNNWDYMQYYMDEALMEIKPDVVVMECDNPRTDLLTLRRDLIPYIRHINEVSPDSRLILWTQPYMTEHNHYFSRREFLLDELKELSKNGNITVLDGKDFFSDEEREIYTYSPLYLTESGLVETALKIADSIRKTGLNN